MDKRKINVVPPQIRPAECHRQGFEILGEAIRKAASEGPIFYVANPGNWGDGLLRYATLEFLKEQGVQFTELRDTSFWRRASGLRAALSRGTLLYGSGGAWCPHFDFAQRTLRRSLWMFRRRIVMPSTFGSRYEISKTTFFRRDQSESKTHMPESTFCHDMSLVFGKIESDSGDGTGYFFRLDDESSADTVIPENNRDLSREGDQNSDALKFLSGIATYSVIHTDRLHVALPAMMLGREVHLYPGAYFKNKAIFDCSIQPAGQNVTFHAEAFGAAK